MLHLYVKRYPSGAMVMGQSERPTVLWFKSSDQSFGMEFPKSILNFVLGNQVVCSPQGNHRSWWINVDVKAENRKTDISDKTYTLLLIVFVLCHRFDGTKSAHNFAQNVCTCIPQYCHRLGKWQWTNVKRPENSRINPTYKYNSCAFWSTAPVVLHNWITLGTVISNLL